MDNFNNAKTRSEARHYVWSESSNGYWYISAPKSAPYQSNDATGSHLNVLWTPEADYCHLTIQIIGGKLSCAHVTIASGSMVNQPQTRLWAQKSRDIPTTRANLVQDTVSKDKLASALCTILMERNLRDQWKNNIRPHIYTYDPANHTGGWANDAVADRFLLQVQTILGELQEIAKDLGIAPGAPFPKS